MKETLSKYVSKLFFKKWIIGICVDDIENIIRARTFNPQIKWIKFNGFESFYADPFLLSVENNEIKLLYELYPYRDNYGKISQITLNKDFSIKKDKTILDTKSHLSFPFIFKENDKTYIFPESAQKERLSCFEYDEIGEKMTFIKDIIELPLRDSTILRFKNKYWIFGTQSDNGTDYKLHIYTSDSLLGNYKAHPLNPMKNGLDGTRSAGNFFTVDGVLYRPTQNCKKSYGESITINRVVELTETSFKEKPFMTIRIDNSRPSNHGIHSIHTINILDDLIVVDGEQWIFAPWQQLKNYLKNRGRVSS